MLGNKRHVVRLSRGIDSEYPLLNGVGLRTVAVPPGIAPDKNQVDYSKIRELSYIYRMLPIISRRLFESGCEIRNGVRTILIGRNYTVNGEGLAIGLRTVTWIFTMTL